MLYTIRNTPDFVIRLYAALEAAQPGDTVALVPETYRVALTDVPERDFDGACYNGVGKKRVLFPLIGKKNVAIDGGGAKLLLQGRITPFALKDCAGVKLGGFTIDYDRPFYSQGTILESDERHLLLDVPREYPYHVENGCIVFTSDTWSASTQERELFLQPFDPATRGPSYNTPCLFAIIDDGSEREVNRAAGSFRARAEQTRDGRLLLTGDFPAAYRVGHVMTMLHEPRICPGLFAVDCVDTTVEDIRMLACASMGFVFQSCTDFALRRIDIRTEEGAKGMLSINADVLHAIVCRGRIVVEDCCFENMDDDAINVHGLYTSVVGVGARCITTRFMHAGYAGMTLFHVGDRVAVFRGHTRELVAELVVRETCKVSDFDTRVTVDGDISAVREGDVADVADAQPDLYIRRCRTGFNRPRGFLVSTAGHVEVEDCVFANSGAALHFTGDTNYWYESGPVRDVTVRHNVFLDCGYGWNCAAIAAEPKFEPTEKAPYYHSNIRVTDNIFYTYNNRLMNMEHVDGVVFRDNRVFRTSTYPDAWNGEGIRMVGCDRVEIE